MESNISSYNKQSKYNIYNNLYDTKRRESILIKDFENKTINNTKEFIKKIEQFNKEIIDIYFSYNNNSNEEDFSNKYIKLKIVNFSNILIDAISINENYIKSTFNKKNKIKFEENKKNSFG